MDLTVLDYCFSFTNLTVSEYCFSFTHLTFLDYCFSFTNYLWYSFIAASMSSSYHWFNLCPWWNSAYLGVILVCISLGCEVPFYPMLNRNKAKHMRTEMITKTNLWEAKHRYIYWVLQAIEVQMYSIFGSFILETLYMIWVKAFVAFNPFIIVNI